MKKSITLFLALCVAALSASAAQRGDINSDGSVNVSDVTALVNQIINGGAGGSGFTNQTFTVNGVSFDVIAVAGGTFTMGATEEQGSDAGSDEKPAHKVTLSPFWIGKTEVTQELWTAVMGSNPSYFRGRGTNLPVENVKWNDCQTFITKLNKLTGKTFRLLTEAEWEFAARGGNKSKGYKYSGSNTIADVAWISGGSMVTKEVATKAPNELGIYDMSGNVTEWCNDFYSDSYYNDSPEQNPTGPETGIFRVYRGGSWYYGASYCRVSDRNLIDPSLPDNTRGLRIAISGPELIEDVNGDGEVNVSDVTALVNLIINGDNSESNGQTFTVNGVSFRMVTVEGGTFTMGATEEQGSDAITDEKPTHQVTLSPYMIGKTEVTQELWQAVMGSNPSKFSGTNLPVEQVSWNDCQTFITKLNQLTGKTFRLPTEAEWEYAARGGNKSQGYKYSGSNTSADVAWYKDNSNSKTHSVPAMSPNELGIYDMSGNVGEWCSDWYGPYSSASLTNPTGPTNGTYRIYRGGYYNSEAKFCRVSYRSYSDPGAQFSNLGFRLVLNCR